MADDDVETIFGQDPDVQGHLTNEDRMSVEGEGRERRGKEGGGTNGGEAHGTQQHVRQLRLSIIQRRDAPRMHRPKPLSRLLPGLAGARKRVGYSHKTRLVLALSNNRELNSFSAKARIQCIQKKSNPFCFLA